MDIKQALAHAHTALKHSTSPRLDGEVLLSHVLQKPKEFLYTYPECQLSKTEQERFFAFVQKRSTGFPVAYITQKKEFYARTFYVDERVLIPRPETEMIIDLVRDIRDKNTAYTIIDIGTGSGCIALTAALEFPKCHVIATDISAKALEVAKMNAQKLQVTTCVFLQGDLLAPVRSYFHDNAIPERSILIANLPYLKDDQMIGDIIHEPKSALIAQNNGLAFYIQLLKQVEQLNLKPEVIILEIDPNQETELLHHTPTSYNSLTHPDLSGTARFIVYKKTTQQ